MKTPNEIARETLGADALAGIGYSQYLPHMEAAIINDRAQRKPRLRLRERVIQEMAHLWGEESLDLSWEENEYMRGQLELAIAIVGYDPDDDDDEQRDVLAAKVYQALKEKA